MYHDLKTWPEYFNAVIAGEKKFEIRKDDRDFKVRDTLLLSEYDPATQMYTGRIQRARVTYIYRGPMVAEGHAILSFRRLPSLG